VMEWASLGLFALGRVPLYCPPPNTFAVGSSRRVPYLPSHHGRRRGLFERHVLDIQFGPFPIHVPLWTALGRTIAMTKRVGGEGVSFWRSILGIQIQSRIIQRLRCWSGTVS